MSRRSWRRCALTSPTRATPATAALTASSDRRVLSSRVIRMSTGYPRSPQPTGSSSAEIATSNIAWPSGSLSSTPSARMVRLDARHGLNKWQQLKIIVTQWRRFEEMLETPGPWLYMATRATMGRRSAVARPSRRALLLVAVCSVGAAGCGAAGHLGAPATTTTVPSTATTSTRTSAPRLLLSPATPALPSGAALVATYAGTGTRKLPEARAGSSSVTISWDCMGPAEVQVLQRDGHMIAASACATTPRSASTFTVRVPVKRFGRSGWRLAAPPSVQYRATVYDN